MMNPFLWLILTVIDLYIYVLIAAAVMSWLIAFNVVNSQNPTVRMIWDFLYRITELSDHCRRGFRGAEACERPAN